ncbi:hypothetical protein MHAS44199_16340 [Mycolicibacterium hassiacum DSM 44199]|nr:hypothetical protein [Mycolicibacterium hassiacum DSM 44199]
MRFELYLRLSGSLLGLNDTVVWFGIPFGVVW